MSQKNLFKLSHSFLTVLSVFILTTLLTQKAQSEPWLSNRLAQNCAGCHAPGRLNLPPIERRCTLSCQGCHVNPNGGGLRNQYGVWSQQRWMRSFTSSAFGKKFQPKPHYDQPYMKRKNADKKLLKPMSFVSDDKIDYVEREYTNKVYTDWHKDAKSKKEFLNRIPKGDPYVLERQKSVYAGGDFRYIYAQQFGDVADEYKTLNFPMSFDMGLRYRPVREKISLVFESRFLNTPGNSDLDQTFTTSSRVRSAYVIADDLWYNSWAMAGLYRPMFGNYTADHTTLTQKISDLDQHAVFKSVGLGTAPNVPFLNVHFLQPLSNTSYSQDSGYVVNLGGRFVTLSANIKLSHWNSQRTPLKLQNSLTSLTMGGMIGRYIGVLEVLNFDIEESAGVRDKGYVFSFENKWRAWREVYATLNIEKANSTQNRKAGETTQYSIGSKAYLVSGTKFELSYIKREEKAESTNTVTNVSLIQLQGHIYF